MSQGSRRKVSTASVTSSGAKSGQTGLSRATVSGCVCSMKSAVKASPMTESELPDPAEAGPVRVLLGSRTGRSMSYGRLVTSIVNPSHRLSGRYRKNEISQQGESLMTSYNDVLTVTQLTDLIAFLQKHYVKAERPSYTYHDHSNQSDDDSESTNPQ